MRKKILVFVVVCVAGAAFYASLTYRKGEMSELVQANVEALATGETGSPHPCFTKWRKAPDSGLAYWDWICSECEPYWLLEGSYRQTCWK